MDAESITLVMPYWERARVARRNLGALHDLYGPDVRFIVVDDGSVHEPAREFVSEFDRVHLIELEKHTQAKNAVTPINVGVKAAGEGIIALQPIEVTHVGPILYTMRSDLRPGRYVSAQVRHEGRWNEHPTIKPGGHGYKPLGCAFHFCVMFYSSLWPGMDEDYRDNGSFDDADLVWRLIERGVQWHFSDVVAEHTHEAKAAKPDHTVNRQKFRRKWPDKKRESLLKTLNISPTTGQSCSKSSDTTAASS